MADNLDKLISLVFSASRKLRERFHPQFTPHGLSMLQLGTLHLISELKTPSMTAIAGELHITRPSATSLIKGLLHSGHLQRIPDKIDKRAVALRLTSKGREATQLAMAGLEQQLRVVLGRLDHQERLTFIKILTKLTRERI
ncbi:MAG: MarR family transcriptional regulator [Candidatus Komeilibacteria bacterium]